MTKQRQQQPQALPTLDLGDGPVIALASHPGDEVFGCGGALARHVQAGQRVVVLSAWGAEQGGPPLSGSALLAESRAAGACLGCEEVRVWSLSKPFVAYDEPAVRRLLGLIDELDPTLIYAPPSDDPDPNRANLGLIAREAVRRAATRCRLAVYELGLPGAPSCLVDITAVLEQKRQAMACLSATSAPTGLDQQTLALNRVRTFGFPPEVTGIEGFGVSSAAEIADLIPGLAVRSVEAGVAVQDPDPLVSILVRTTARDTLNDALDSIAGQTYRRIEVVLIDVRGTRDLPCLDGCGEFPLHIASAGLPLGRGAAANLGLEAASGELVIFLDDDDWFLPEHIAGLVSAIQGSGGALAAYAGIECRSRTPEGEWRVDHLFNQPHDPLRLLVENYLPIHAVLFARRLVGDALRFDESLEVYEDWDFWIQLSELTPLVHVDRVTGVYRIHRGSGFGVGRSATELNPGLAALLGKWCPRWSLEQWLGVAEYAKYHAMYQELRDQSALRHKELSEQLDQARFDREQWKIQCAILSAEKRAVEEQISGFHQRILAEDARNRSIESARAADRELLNVLGIQSLNDALWCREELALHRSLQGRILASIARMRTRLEPRYRAFEDFAHRLTSPVARIFSHIGHLMSAVYSYGPVAVLQALMCKLKAPSTCARPSIGNLWLVLEIASLELKRSPWPKIAILVDPTRASAETIRLLKGLTQSSQAPSSELIFLYPNNHPIGPLLERRVPGGRHLAYDADAGLVAGLSVALGHSHADWLLVMSFVNVQPNDWLSRLVQTAQDVRLGGAMASVVCPRVMGTDGRLVQAGSLRARDGRLLPIGAGQDPGAPEYAYLREVDGGSDDCLLLNRQALQESIGSLAATGAVRPSLAEVFGEMRARGSAILYQPEVTVVVAARPLARSGGGEPVARDRRRALVLDAVMLTPDQDSGSLRMFNLLETFLEQDWHVTFAPSNLEFRDPYGARLQRRGVEVLYSPQVESIPAFLSRRGAEYDLVILSRADVASQFLDDVRLHAPQARVWFDTVDLHFLREVREAELRDDPAVRELAELRKRQEIDLMRRTDLTLVVSSIEQDLLAREVPDVRVEILSNIHDPHPTDAPFAYRDAIIFIGGFNHVPNVDAARYYVEEIQPLVQAELGKVPTFIIGSRPPIEVLALEDLDRELHVTGYVEDVTPYFERARLSIAPLRYGAGVKGKINTSMAYGVPVVATPCAAEGMSLRPETDILIGDDPAAFAAAVSRLYRDSILWETLARNGLKNIEDHFSRRVARATLERLVLECGA